jgi:hypothetical protein
MSENEDIIEKHRVFFERRNMSEKGKITIAGDVNIFKYDGSAGKINLVPGEDLYQETTVVKKTSQNCSPCSRTSRRGKNASERGA